MRIAIVNDMRMATEVLRRIVAGAGHEVAWTALDGQEAVRRCAADVPDLILMDLIMPVMNGAESTKAIMRATPCPILVVTASVEQNIALVFAALGHGALDAVCTPALGSDGTLGGGDLLLAKIARLGAMAAPAVMAPVHTSPAAAPAAASRQAAPLPPLVLIGASTGGPRVLATLLAALPAGYRGAVVIAQHIDREFAGGMAGWLAEQAKLPVRLVQPGERPAAGTVLISGENDHLVLQADRTLTYAAEPRSVPYRPSVDELFMSAARHWPAPGLAVLLTGIGRDGAAGMLALRQAGWTTVAQDEASSVVYGMPKAARDNGGAEQVLPPARIALTMTEWAEARGEHP